MSEADELRNIRGKTDISALHNTTAACVTLPVPVALAHSLSLPSPHTLYTAPSCGMA